MIAPIASQTASKQLSDDQDNLSRLSISFLALALIIFIPESAYADGDPLSKTICLVISWMTGGLGQAIATLGIVVLGIGAMLGKVSWQMALIVAFGLSVMFSGAQVVNLLTGKAVVCPIGLSFRAGYLESVLCQVAALANSPTGQALGTLAIIFLGVSALMGKVSAGLALLLSVGIGIMYGADDIGRTLVTSLDGGSWIPCSPTPIT